MSDAALALEILLVIALVVGGWLLLSYIFYRIGKKFGIGNFWDYCVPFYNSVLLCRCAGISPWNLLWLFVPPIAVRFAVYLWGKIAVRLGYNFWLYGVGVTFFFIPILILAFDDSVPEAQQPETTTGPDIYCLSGEFAGNHMQVGEAGVTIGRSPAKANLVLSSLDVSAMHARVWSDRQGRVWLQDMSSVNGTFYSKLGTAGTPEWVEVKAPVVLATGSHFRVGDNAAEFVVS